MYCGVPTIWRTPVSVVRAPTGEPVALAIPKSITLQAGTPSCAVARMFDGLMSRWMTPFWWACYTARQTWANNSSRCRTPRRFSSQYWVIGTPVTSSITK